MIAFVLAATLAGSLISGPVNAKPSTGFVVEFASSTKPDDAAVHLQRLENAGLKDVRVLSSPLQGDRHVYRVVSRRFASYGEAQLAAMEARRVLAKAAVGVNGVILAADTAGLPIIR